MITQVCYVHMDVQSYPQISKQKEIIYKEVINKKDVLIAD